MSGESPKSSGISPKGGRGMIGAKAEARELVSLIAGPVRLGDNVKAVLSRVAEATGLGDRRVRGIWNGEARTIRAEEMDRLRAAARQARAVEDAQHELVTLRARLAACEAALRLPAEDLVGSCADAVGAASGTAHRPLDRAGRGLTVPAVGRSLT